MTMKQINRKKVNLWWWPVDKSDRQAGNLH
jgi:hypothetical protein